MQTPVRILLVDDNPDDRTLVMREVRREIGEVFFCEAINAAQLAEALESEFDLVITDYQLCWTDGLVILHEVKRRQPSCPVIMFTGTGSEEVAVQAMKSGLEDYVLKSPKHYARLATAVRATLERVQTKTRADELDRRLHTLLNRLNVGVFRANSDGLLLEANPAFLQLLGWRELPRDIYLRELYFRPEIHAEHLHQLKTSGELREYQVELCRADGSSVLVSLTQSMTPVSEDEKVIDGLVENISHRIRLEEQLRQTQKLESIGRLAAGVAHDFNNILTIIQGYAGLLAEKEFDADTTFSLKNIAAAAERASKLTWQLLAFSRKQTMRTEPIDLNQLVHNFSGLLHHAIGDKISLDLNLTPSLPAVRGDDGLLQQVLMNFALNARDAMPNGGKFSIGTNLVELEGNYVRANWEARPGLFVCLVINDTGSGIPPEHLEHIFEPFFTTKEVGKGTGLGLAAVYGIVKQHKGWIEVMSRVGHGTSFRIYFPAEPKVISAPAMNMPLRDASETVLLVEDEPELLGIITEILQASGYCVIPAASGKKALELWEHSRQKIDLLVTDVKMPDVTGLELAQTLVADNPRLKVLYTSGYSPDAMEPKVHLLEGFNYLQKPYPPERLLAVIRKVLETCSIKV